MSDLIIKEVIDGRLPEYQVLEEDRIIKTFDSIEEAESFIEQTKITPCGEENPCG